MAGTYGRKNQVQGKKQKVRYTVPKNPCGRAPVGLDNQGAQSAGGVAGSDPHGRRSCRIDGNGRNFHDVSPLKGVENVVYVSISQGQQLANFVHFYEFFNFWLTLRALRLQSRRFILLILRRNSHMQSKKIGSIATPFLKEKTSVHPDLFPEMEIFFAVAIFFHLVDQASAAKLKMQPQAFRIRYPGVSIIKELQKNQ
ncbi:MAG: hypothetical protein ABR512_04140 [Desulfopila sp.]